MFRKDVPFLITISYLGSLLTIRLMVIIAGSAESEFASAAKEGLPPQVDFYLGRNIIVFGYHIHHFYFGIALICIAGWLALVGSSYFNRHKIALMYGTGLGLFMDEIGLLLTWGDYYSSVTYLLSILLVGVFLNIVFFPYFWREVRSNFQEASPTGFYQRLFHKNIVIKVADSVSEKTGRTEKTSLIFTGLIYILVGILIIFYPRFVYYWVAGGFFIQGVSSLVRAWSRED